MGKFIENLYKWIAKFYNSLSDKTRLLLMLATSILAAKLLSLLVQDLQSAQWNPYIWAVVNFLTDPEYGVIIIVINILQKFVKDKGTELLALEGDKKTIKQLDQKIEEVKALKESSN